MRTGDFRHFDDAVLSAARVERVTLQRLVPELPQRTGGAGSRAAGIGNHHDHVEVAVVAMHAVIDHAAADGMEFLQGLQRIVAAAAPTNAGAVGPGVAALRCG
ncbi:hypothetical protein ACQP2U_28415 [Nocardia sp. CA-084685]|uniref:hypothetical protein n=1 Tax=Nocardia sp. CA-084685 TaxID=3239970 RepID=UPI003D950B35